MIFPRFLEPGQTYLTPRRRGGFFGGILNRGTWKTGMLCGGKLKYLSGAACSLAHVNAISGSADGYKRIKLCLVSQLLSTRTLTSDCALRFLAFARRKPSSEAPPVTPPGSQTTSNRDSQNGSVVVYTTPAAGGIPHYRWEGSDMISSKTRCVADSDTSTTSRTRCTLQMGRT
jgi:hypothetical protein